MSACPVSDNPRLGSRWLQCECAAFFLSTFCEINSSKVQWLLGAGEVQYAGNAQYTCSYSYEYAKFVPDSRQWQI